MPGAYIHIPFCRSRCDYCNFFSLASQRNVDEITEIICYETELRKDYLGGKTLSTVYFGGGSPSLLQAVSIKQILQKINQTFGIEPDAEITLEANPDDIGPEKLRILRESGINRLSIGIQSFIQADLNYLSRKHNTEHALRSIECALESGFTNLGIDLIFGIPTQNLASLEKNLEIFGSYKLPHLSAYALTVEPKTALSAKIAQGIAQSVDEEIQADHFLFIMGWMEAHGYEHYEISNFCLPGYESRHNSSYWNGEPYIGLGPSAHSFDGGSRQWNIANLAKYMSGIRSGKPYFEKEILTVVQKHNEYLMTAIRTSKGINLMDFADNFGTEAFGMLMKNARAFSKLPIAASPRQAENPWLIEADGFLRLSRHGKLFADNIASSLFMSE